jgi:hypothetical protein
MGEFGRDPNINGKKELARPVAETEQSGGGALVARGQSRLRTWTMPKPSTQRTPAVQPKSFGQRRWLNS